MRGKRAFKNILISLILQIITLLCGFIVPKLIIESYGSEVNGLINSITQFLGYIVLLEAGIGPVIKSCLYKPLSKKDSSELINILNASEIFFKKISIVFVIYIVILSFLYPVFINNEFNSLFTISLIFIISISTFCEYYFGMTYRLFLKANQESYIISYIQIFTLILNTIITILLIRFKFSIHVVKLFSSLIFILRPLAQYYYVKRKYNFDLKKADKGYKLNQKWDGLSQHIAAVIHDNTDVVVLTLFCNLKIVSIYSVYFLVIKGIKNLIESLTNGIDAAFGDMIAKGEISILNKSFEKYEFLYFSIITIVFSCTFVLITPFIYVYTSGITDANYIQLYFGYIIVLAELIYAIRIPYNVLVLSAGKFKCMNKAAWVEAITNILISIALVIKYGLVGVAIGTFISMLYRTIDFIILASKDILKRKYNIIFKRVFICSNELLIIFIINSIMINCIVVNSFVNWFIYAIIIFIFSVIVYVLLLLLFDRHKLIYIKSIKGGNVNA